MNGWITYMKSYMVHSYVTWSIEFCVKEVGLTHIWEINAFKILLFVETWVAVPISLHISSQNILTMLGTNEKMIWNLTMSWNGSFWWSPKFSQQKTKSQQGKQGCHARIKLPMTLKWLYKFICHMFHKATILFLTLQRFTLYYLILLICHWTFHIYLQNDPALC